MNINWKKLDRDNWILNPNVAVAKDWMLETWYPIINGKWRGLGEQTAAEAIALAEKLAKEEGYL